MSEPVTKPRIFLINEERSAKLDAIAGHLRVKLGLSTRVSRSDAIGILIDRFNVPGWSFEGSSIPEVTKPAA